MPGDFDSRKRLSRTILLRNATAVVVKRALSFVVLDLFDLAGKYLVVHALDRFLLQSFLSLCELQLGVVAILTALSSFLTCRRFYLALRGFFVLLATLELLLAHFCLNLVDFLLGQLDQLFVWRRTEELFVRESERHEVHEDCQGYCALAYGPLLLLDRLLEVDQGLPQRNYVLILHR